MITRMIRAKTKWHQTPWLHRFIPLPAREKKQDENPPEWCHCSGLDNAKMAQSRNCNCDCECRILRPWSTFVFISRWLSSCTSRHLACIKITACILGPIFPRHRKDLGLQLSHSVFSCLSLPIVETPQESQETFSPGLLHQHQRLGLYLSLPSDRLQAVWAYPLWLNN